MAGSCRLGQSHNGLYNEQSQWTETEICRQLLRHYVSAHLKFFQLEDCWLCLYGEGIILIDRNIKVQILKLKVQGHMRWSCLYMYTQHEPWYLAYMYKLPSHWIKQEPSIVGYCLGQKEFTRQISLKRGPPLLSMYGKSGVHTEGRWTRVTGALTDNEQLGAGSK